MAKNKLENMLGFKEFSELPTYKKSTKRTDVGGDILNESIYDKIRNAAKEDRDYSKLVEKFTTYLKNTCDSGLAKDIEIDGDIAKFKVNKRAYKLNKNGTVILYAPTFEKYKDDKNKTRSRRTGEEDVTVRIDPDDASEIYDIVEELED